MILDNFGYNYKPFSGPSGTPRYYKDFNKPIGIIFYFIGKDPEFLYCLVRGVKKEFLEDIYDEQIKISELTEEKINKIEAYLLGSNL